MRETWTWQPCQLRSGRWRACEWETVPELTIILLPTCDLRVIVGCMDARPAAATMLLLFGVAERTVMGVRCWSHTAIVAQYQHLTTTIRQDVAQRIGGLLWEPAENASSDHRGGGD